MKYRNGYPAPSPALIVRRMDALGLDHAQLAALLDVNRSTLGHWRSGRRTPQYVHARALFGPIDRLESVPAWVGGEE